MLRSEGAVSLDISDNELNLHIKVGEQLTGTAGMKAVIYSWAILKSRSCIQSQEKDNLR